MSTAAAPPTLHATLTTSWEGIIKVCAFLFLQLLPISLAMFFPLLSLLVNLHSIIHSLFVHSVKAVFLFSFLFFEVWDNILLVLVHIFLCYISRLAGTDDGEKQCTAQWRKQKQQQWGNYGLMLHNLHFILCYLHYSAPLESAIKGN